MSWTQGILLREELNPKIVAWAEDRYFREYNEKGQLQYVVWDDCDPKHELVFDFGNQKCLVYTPEDKK